MDAVQPQPHSWLAACATCGLVQRCLHAEAGWRAHCPRCGAPIADRAGRVAMCSRTAAAASAALILYPFAIGLPIMRVERFGQFHDANAWQAAMALLSSDHVGIGVVVLACSIIIPLAKLVALLDLSLRRGQGDPRRRALVAHVVEWTGRWSMIDVLLVAVLVAVIKLGSFMEVSAGSGAVAFTGMVVLSLVASACFDPRLLWEDG